MPVCFLHAAHLTSDETWKTSSHHKALLFTTSTGAAWPSRQSSQPKKGATESQPTKQTNKQTNKQTKKKSCNPMFLLLTCFFLKGKLFSASKLGAACGTLTLATCQLVTLVDKESKIDMWFRIHMGISKNSGFYPPNHPMFNRIFFTINHPFWGYHYFWKHPYVCFSRDKQKRIRFLLKWSHFSA